MTLYRVTEGDSGGRATSFKVVWVASLSRYHYELRRELREGARHERTEEMSDAGRGHSQGKGPEAGKGLGRKKKGTRLESN